MSFKTELKHQVIQTFGNMTRVRKLESGEYFYPVNIGGGLNNVNYEDAFFVPEVNAILNKRASAKSQMRIEVVNKKTLEPVENNVSALLKNPNWFQSQNEFQNQSSLFRDIFGNEYLYMFFGVGINPERTKVLTSLHPKYMKIKYKSDTPYFQETETPDDLVYEYTLAGKRFPIPGEQIVHNNDNRVQFFQQDEKLLKGQSKLKALTKPINNIILAYGSRGVLIRTRGALGILSNDSRDGLGTALPLDDKETEKLQSEYRRYGVSEDQYQIIITNMALKWQNMAVDTDKLKLFEEVQEDYIKIAEAFNYPPELLARSNSSPNLFGDNKKQSRKAWYEDSIIPESQEWIGSLNAKFETDRKPWTIIGTFDHLPFMATDLKDKGTSLTLVVNGLSKAFADGAISLEEYQEELRKFGFIETDVN